MLNNIRIIGLKLNARMILFSHIHARRHLHHLSTASSMMTLNYSERCQTSIKRSFKFINVMNLLDLLLKISPYFVVIWFRFVTLGGERSDEMYGGVSFQKVDCLAPLSAQ